MIGGTYDESGGDYYPPEPVQPPQSSQGPPPTNQTPEERRRLVISDFIIPAYREILGRDPTEEEINSDFDVYVRHGGTAVRDSLSARKGGPGPVAGTLGGIAQGPQPYGGPWEPSFNLAGAPKFSFRAPSLDEARNEPGYEFARSEGNRGLEQSAAGRGVLRTGGTLKDLASWNNRFAEQNYGNVFDRSFRTAQAEYAPQFADWQARTAAEMERGRGAFQRPWDQYVYGSDDRYRYDKMLYEGGLT